MKNIEMTDKEQFVAELALRIVFCGLLDKEEEVIESIQCVAHNFKVGSFGKKAYKPEDSNDWIQYLQPMRDLIDKLSPDYRKLREELGSEPYMLPEELKVMDEDQLPALYKSTQYKEAIAKMNSIKDRPICVFVFNDLDKPNRIQTMSIVAAEHLEQKGVGRITMASFNHHVQANLKDNP